MQASSRQGVIMTLHKTCAFDSLLQLVASRIATHEAYREATESCTDGIFKLARSILENGRLFSIHYNERASILEICHSFVTR